MDNLINKKSNSILETDTMKIDKNIKIIICTVSLLKTSKSLFYRDFEA